MCIIYMYVKQTRHFVVLECKITCFGAMVSVLLRRENYLFHAYKRNRQEMWHVRENKLNIFATDKGILSAFFMNENDKG